MLSGEYCEWGNGITLKSTSSGKKGFASVSALQELVKGPAAHGRRMLLLCDNETSVYVLNKGRSPEWALLRICRKALALAVASGSRPRWRHLEGYRHPCDGPTRPSAPGRHGVLPITPGAVLEQHSALCASGCPPGLCCC